MPIAHGRQGPWPGFDNKNNIAFIRIVSLFYFDKHFASSVANENEESKPTQPLP